MNPDSHQLIFLGGGFFISIDKLKFDEMEKEQSSIFKNNSLIIKFLRKYLDKSFLQHNFIPKIMMPPGWYKLPSTQR